MADDNSPREVTDEDKARFWRSFLLATETEPRTALEIKGASGITHPVSAVGVDDVRRRIVVVSRDVDPKAAALAQIDIQAANSGYQVVLARPIAVNFAPLAAAFADFLGGDVLGRPEIDRLSQANAADKDALTRDLIQRTRGEIFGFERAAVHTLAIFHEILRQISYVTVEVSKPEAQTDGAVSVAFLLRNLIELDPSSADRALGNCGVPLYDFDQPDAEVLQRGNSIEAAREILRRRQVLQYFFPAPDDLALGITDGGISKAALVRAVSQSASIGHPLGPAELLPPGTSLDEVVERLRDQQYLVEGEIGYELSESGRNYRATVKFKPREGFLAKLSRVFRLKVDIDLSHFMK